MFIHLAKAAYANIVFEIASHGYPVEVARGVLKTLLGSHVCHLFICDSKNFASKVASFICCFIRNIWTVSTVILPSFKKRSIDQNPTRIVGVFADYVKERIRGCSFSQGIVPFAFEMLSELEGVDIKGSGWLMWKRVIIIDRGIRDRKVFLGGYMVSRWFITSVDYSVEEWVSIFAGKGRRDCRFIPKSALGVVRVEKA